MKGEIKRYMIPELLKEYPEGSNLTIMNTFYQYPVFENNKKICDDFIILVYKDNDTGEKKKEIIMKPEYTYYKAKKGINLDYNRLFIERDKVEPVTVPFRDLEKSIAENTGNEDFYKQNLVNKNRSENKKLHTDPNIFFSDTSIEDHYRFKFSQIYTNNIEKLNKGFFDIEVDGKFAKGDFVEMGECPINCVSYHDESSNKVYTFILRNIENPLIQQFENKIVSGEFGFKQIHDFVITSVGGEKQAKKFGLIETQFEVYFYDYEIELIRDLFATMHRTSPDFIEGWNSSAFDLEYIIERIIQLGYDPADIMCDQRWPVKVVKNYVDHRHINELAERGDYTFISGLPIFIDQMIQYASRRKSKIGSFKSFKLDDIGLKEAKVQKLDYHHITNSVVELPWLDFQTFFLYNIMDVIVQKCIENKTNDLEYIFSKCVVNNTVYQKGHRQTIYLINRMASDWYKMGYIIGNNVNKWNEKPPKFLGALVGDPKHTNDFSKLKLNGRAIWVCDNLQDYD
jgi:DNA polymerase elongation subunit (family B)